MRMRKITDTGDYVFGKGPNNFHKDTPDGVGLLAKERMNLWTGQWFLAMNDGLPVFTQIAGKGTEFTRDVAIRARLLGTLGVAEISAYNATLNRDTRGYSVQATLKTAYGQIDYTGPR